MKILQMEEKVSAIWLKGGNDEMYLYRADFLVSAVLCILDCRNDLGCIAQKKRRER